MTRIGAGLETMQSLRADAATTLRAGSLDRFRLQAAETHTVRAGETLSGIAQRYGTTVDALVQRNGIRNPDLIHPGQQIQLHDGAVSHYTVQRGDTLSAIAAAHGTSIAALRAANPEIVNPDLIYPDQQIAIPAELSLPQPAGPGGGGVQPAPREERPAPVERVEQPGVQQGVLQLTAQDVIDLKKTLQTEWVQSAGVEQAHGIIDTILNRQASGRWGSSVADVVNAPYQFSDINGPVAWQRGRNSVSDIPASRISARVDAVVDAYLAERAAGRPSAVGSHLNYANPNYSSRSNLGWINRLDGPVLGRGDAIHRHGTTPDLERWRPQPFTIRLP